MSDIFDLAKNMVDSVAKATEQRLDAEITWTDTTDDNGSPVEPRPILNICSPPEVSITTMTEQELQTIVKTATNSDVEIYWENVGDDVAYVIVPIIKITKRKAGFFDFLIKFFRCE